MAIKEFWIQIENQPWNTALNAIDPIKAPSMAENFTTGLTLAPVHPSCDPGVAGHAGLRSAVREKKAREGQCKKDTHVLVLRRYRPPLRKDRSDAWTVPDDPGASRDRDLMNCIAAHPVCGPTLECQSGDRVVVHCRNNDQRKKSVARMIELDLPFGGSLMLPTTFNELFPTEERTHCLHPCCLTAVPAHDEIIPPALAEPNQPVGSEAPLWSEIGVRAFKQGDRIPPGGTFTYRWDPRGWYRALQYPTGHLTRFTIRRKSFSARSDAR